MTHLIRRFAAATAAAALTLTLAPTALAGDAEQARFESMLRAIDVVPTRVQLDATWPDAKERLLDAAQDDARDQWTRSRALSLLSFYPEDDVRAALAALAVHRAAPVRELAIYTAARTFGDPGDPELVALVTEGARDAHAKVRDKAVRALRWIDHPAAERALERLARDGDDPRLRSLVEHVQDRRRDRLRR